MKGYFRFITFQLFTSAYFVEYLSVYRTGKHVSLRFFQHITRCFTFSFVTLTAWITSPWWQWDSGSEGGFSKAHLTTTHHTCSEITMNSGTGGSDFVEMKRQKWFLPPYFSRFFFFLSFSHRPNQNCVCVNFGVQHDQFIGVAWPAFLLNTPISQPSCPLFALLCPCNSVSLGPPCCAMLSFATRLSHAGRHLGKMTVDLNRETPESLFRPWTYNLWMLWNSDLHTRAPTNPELPTRSW